MTTVRILVVAGTSSTAIDLAASGPAIEQTLAAFYRRTIEEERALVDCLLRAPPTPPLGVAPPPPRAPRVLLPRGQVLTARRSDAPRRPCYRGRP